MQTATATPGGRYARVLPYGALLVTMVSVQFGAAFSKQLFPVLGVERTTFLRLGLGALLLAPILRPWQMRVPRQQWPLLMLYSAVARRDEPVLLPGGPAHPPWGLRLRWSS